MAARGAEALAAIEREVVECRRCPRLVEWRERVARGKVARFRDEEYWGRPVPGFGDPNARILLLGLAPAAHGGNRTGRVFTGDASGDFLWPALHAAGLASRPTSARRGDGLEAIDLWVTAPVKSAPPDNKPLPDEILNCREYLAREWALLPRVRAVLALGRIGLDGFCALLRAQGRLPARGRLPFGHGVSHDLGDGLRLFCSFHPSQQNTFTGRLTAADLDRVLRDVKRHLARA